MLPEVDEAFRLDPKNLQELVHVCRQLFVHSDLRVLRGTVHEAGQCEEIGKCDLGRLDVRA